MEIFERIRHLRKDVLKMTQDAFGVALGVNRDVIKNIELNRLAKPEQKEPLYKLICKSFNVNYEWLTTGNGDMYVESEEVIISALVSEFNLDTMGKNILKAYKALDDTQRGGVKAFINVLAQTVIQESNAAALDDTETETPLPVDFVDKVIERTNERMYRAASSKKDTLHEVIEDGAADVLDNVRGVRHKDVAAYENLKKPETS